MTSAHQHNELHWKFSNYTSRKVCSLHYVPFHTGTYHTSAIGQYQLYNINQPLYGVRLCLEHTELLDEQCVEIGSGGRNMGPHSSSEAKNW